jgi:hypothetical protein
VSQQNHSNYHYSTNWGTEFLRRVNLFCV